MLLFDTHCHLDADDFSSNVASIWKEATNNAIEGCIIPALNGKIKSYKKLLGLKGVHCSYGYHPANASNNIIEEIRNIDLKTIGYRPVAIGECGLDKHVNIPRELQIDVFEAQLILAERNKLPVIVHLVGYWKEALSLLKTLNLNIILHSFSGSKEIAKQFLDIGCYFSFSASLMNKGFFKAKESVTIIPSDRIFIESDAPSMKPDTWDGRYNKPSTLPLVFKTMAKLRKVSEHKLSIILRKNLNTVFPQICRSNSNNGQ